MIPPFSSIPASVVKKDKAQTLTNKTLTSPLFQGSLDAWISANETWEWNDATHITVPSGAASKYQKGMPFKLTANSVVLQGYIVAIADTVLTVVGDALTNHTFTNNFYAPSGTVPLGFTDWFSWTTTPSYGGGTTDPTSNTIDEAKFQIQGSGVRFYIKATIVRGTGNRTYVKYTMPTTFASPATTCHFSGWESIAQASITTRAIFTESNKATMFIIGAMANDGLVSIAGFYPF